VHAHNSPQYVFIKMGAGVERETNREGVVGREGGGERERERPTHPWF